MTMVHDNMIKAYRAGKVEDIRSYDFKFNQWAWTSISKIFPEEVVVQPIDVGITQDASFWQNYDKNDVRFVGYRLGAYKKGPNEDGWKMPIHNRVDIEPSDYVFCIDQLNDVSKEDRVKAILENLIAYSNKYILISCWAYDIKIPDEVICRKRHYWELDRYFYLFEKNGFKLIVKAVSSDAINVLYVFKRKF
jgi:hypothetical protein